ncbi:MAG: MiaB/RimO family radical SAM methylthiotransferase [Acidimicrobiales bacterium]
MPASYWLETLGCPKNEVDSAKLAGTLAVAGLHPAGDPEHADIVVVNTCAFIEAARQESVNTILELSRSRRPGSRLVVTGCLAERYGDELATAMPEVDLVAGFGESLLDGTGILADHVDAGSGPSAVPTRVAVGAPTRRKIPAFDLLELPRPAASAPWAYVKIAEGCDRRCAYCAIPSFRGAQRSRTAESVLEEIDALGPALREVVLVAQDLASWALDRSAAGDRTVSPRPVVQLLERVAERVDRVRLLYLYPSSVDDALVDAICATGVPYFDLSLQHVSRGHLKRMHRPGHRARFTELIGRIRDRAPEAALRSSFILGFPGETEEDHDELLGFLEEVELDWAGFFTFSEEPGTPAFGLEPAVAPGLALDRLRECSEIQDAVTSRKRQALVGSPLSVLVDSPGVGRTHREAPEIDGVINVPSDISPGSIVEVIATGAAGPDLWAEVSAPEPVGAPGHLVAAL